MQLCQPTEDDSRGLLQCGKALRREGAGLSDGRRCDADLPEHPTDPPAQSDDTPEPGDTHRQLVSQ